MHSESTFVKARELRALAVRLRSHATQPRGDAQAALETLCRCTACTETFWLLRSSSP